MLPLIADNHPLGAIWIMSHDEQRHFDSEDVRVMTSLADFAVAALRLNQRQTEKSFNQLITRLSEEGLRLATEAANIYAWEIDLICETFTWSENAGRLLDFPMPPKLDVAWAAVHPEDVVQMQKSFAQAVENVGEFKVEYRVISPITGKEFWLFSSGVTIAQADGTPIGMVGVTQDIGDRKQAEQALRESEEKYRTLFDSIDEGFCIFEMIYQVHIYRRNYSPFDSG
jgi:PAS domain-containing protein